MLICKHYSHRQIDFKLFDECFNQSINQLINQLITWTSIRGACTPKNVNLIVLALIKLATNYPSHSNLNKWLNILNILGNLPTTFQTEIPFLKLSEEMLLFGFFAPSGMLRSLQHPSKNWIVGNTLSSMLIGCGW